MSMRKLKKTASRKMTREDINQKPKKSRHLDPEAIAEELSEDVYYLYSEFGLDPEEALHCIADRNESGCGNGIGKKNRFWKRVIMSTEFTVITGRACMMKILAENPKVTTSPRKLLTGSPMS